MARLGILVQNASTIPDALVLDVVAAVAPPELIGDVHVFVNEYDGKRGGGEAFTATCDQHNDKCQSIEVTVAETEELARDDGEWREPPYQRYAVGSRTEVLVAITAHEFFHCWQAQEQGPYGPYNERAADAYAIQKLRQYRQGRLLGGQR